jgi:Mrp family chromosome partitioning ATPase
VPVEVVEELAAALREAGDLGRRVAVFGATRNIGTSFAAITLARTLAHDARVVLIDLALGAPNLAVISTDPLAPGIVELAAGSANVGEVIMRDQMSPVHLIAAGQRVESPSAVLNSSRLAVTIEALGRAYDHVVLDDGAVPDSDVEQLAQFARTAVLVVADPAHRDAGAARKRLEAAGFGEIAMLVAA